MFRKAAQFALLLFLLAATAGYVAAQTAVQKTAGSQAITGCLQKGLEPGGFFLLTPDNKHWEIYNAGNVPLADHVGQTVALTGGSPTRTAAQEQVSRPYEQQEAGTRQHADFQASSLSVVSASCGN